ncbi:MAG: hypothetical protein A3G81_06785 [Betaproteobacteria bacterium RIFCSPLOWO2_12_FULL_65_14]|nr:MAG: hypothetical protein A3G81_06785 [Betaproteobacteria bacterium RIFCSPLOWO2_12_FULL_65_14]
MCVLDAPMIPLPNAVTACFEHIFPGEKDRDKRLRDVIALALSELIAIYRTDGDGGLCKLTDAEIVAEGLLRDPGKLLVSRDDLERAMARLQGESLDTARVRLALRHSPKSK